LARDDHRGFRLASRRSGAARRVLQARVPILAHARQAPGCLDFSLSADLLDAGRINVYEHWRSREDLRAYRAGDGPELDDTIELTAADVELHHISASEAP
jgi:quinol monooxygenase YgiN